MSLGKFSPEDNKPKGKEVLIHNLSHSDMILGIKTLLDQDTIVARPKFSQFNSVSLDLYNHIRSHSDSKIYTHPGLTSRENPVKDKDIPTGFEFPQDAIFHWTSDQLRFRDDDKAKLDVLIHNWLKHTADHYKKIVVLVSGKGEPVDRSTEDKDNSTEFTAKLIELFINQAYAGLIEVQHIHSTTNLFRYDSNIAFVKQDLLPKIEEIREDLLDGLDPKWKDKLKITISFADGSSARISAINASLKNYRPSYMHFWVLKTFWREKKIYYDDVETHNYEEISTEIAVPLEYNKDQLVTKAVKEMEQFRKIITESLQKKNDLKSFWLRKTKKLVLAVLVVQKEGEPEQIYKGTNMEVSMPTGSLCAERNVIGSALAADVTLMRKDIKVIAVYSYPSIDNPSASSTNTAADGIAAQPFLSSPLQSQYSIGEEEPANKRMRLDGTPLITRERSNSDSESVAMDFRDGVGPLTPAKSPIHNKRKIHNLDRLNSEGSVMSQSSIPVRTPLNTQTTGMRRENSKTILKNVLFDTSSTANYCTVIPNQARSRSIEVDQSDLNPIKPCGACNEWLKKIAEVNPKLKVVTFTDANCEGIYVENINDF